MKNLPAFPIGGDYVFSAYIVGMVVIVGILFLFQLFTIAHCVTNKKLTTGEKSQFLFIIVFTVLFIGGGAIWYSLRPYQSLWLRRTGYIMILIAILGAIGLTVMFLHHLNQLQDPMSPAWKQIDRAHGVQVR
jgi:hypothetical protein